MIKKYDNLDNNYLLGDGSVPIAINDAIPLEITDGEILTTLSLEDYNKIAFVVENDSTVNIDYLAMLGTQSSDSTIEIVKDVTASSGYALKLTGAQRIIFATKTSYIPDLLKKLTVKARCAPGNTNTLTASLVGYQDGNFINKDGAPLLTNYPKITLNEEGLTDSYATYVGFVSGVGSSYKEGTSTADAPSNMPTGTDEVAMILESSGGIFYVDVISLEEVPNSIREIPEGTGVYNMVADISSDNRITPSEKQALKIEWEAIQSEYTTYISEATARNLSTINYSNAYTALDTYLTVTADIFSDLATSSDVDGSIMRSHFITYYNGKGTLLSEISDYNAAQFTISADSYTINYSSRGVLQSPYVVFTISYDIVPIAIDGISTVDWKAYDTAGNNITSEVTFEQVQSEIDAWVSGTDYAVDDVVEGTDDNLYNCILSSGSGGTDAEPITGVNWETYWELVSVGNYDLSKIALDSSTVDVYTIIIEASTTYNNTVYKDTATINKVSEGVPTPLYLGARTDIPLATEEGPLAKGDYFLYIGEYDGPNTEPVPPTDKTNPLYLNPTLTETNEFVYGRMYEYIGKDSIGTDLWKETRKSEHFASAQKDALEIAKSSGVYLYVAVVVAQLGLFNDLLVANKLSSTNYKEDANGVPTKGFLLDGPGDIIKAYAMEAYNSKIFGTVESTGFKTLTGTTPVTISRVFIPKTVWNHDEMVGIIPNQDSMINISGTIDGFNFARAVRRNNKRILQKEHGYESEDISAGEEHYFTRLYPDIGWGSSFFVEVSGYYSGLSSFRRYVGGGYVSENLSSSYYFARTLNLDGSGIRFGMMHKSEALWGKKSSHVNYHKIWTSQLFNGLILTTTPYNPDYGAYFDYKVIPYEPNAYYPNTITWNIGANNQNTLSNYVSGTEFYNLFYQLPPIADGYVSAGKIKVKRIGQPLTEYTVTRLVKDGNGISFYTNLGIVRVDKFSEGTSSGVYEHLEITQAIEFKTVPDGIEVKSVLPWGTFIQDVENVAIGTNDARFEYGYFKYLDVLTNMLIRGTLNVAGVNTGYGDNEVYKISEETVDFGDVSGTNKTMSISAMDIKEIRTVNTTGCLGKSSSRTYYLYLKLPAGGTYHVVGQSAGSEIAAHTTVYGGVLSGGTFVAQLRNHDVVLAFFNVALIIRRIS